MDNNKINLSLKEGVLSISLNNPTKLNCMGFRMLKQLNDALKNAENDKEVKVIIIKGVGERAFSTGADLKEFGGLDSTQQVEWIEFGNEVFNRLESIGKPTIAFIHGYALGGGLELALACDFRIATPHAIFSNPELQHGWLPGWGGMTRLRRLFGEAVAKEIVLLGQKIDADKARKLGLLTCVVENESSNEYLNIIQHLKTIDSSAFALAKTAIADENRTTRGVDVKFDVLAMQLVSQKKPV